MAIDDIVAAIAREGADEAARVERDAEREAAAVLERARAEAARVEAAAAGARDAEVETEAAGVRGRARLEAARRVRAAREAAFERALADGRRALAALRAGPAYAGVLRALLAEALRALGGADGGALRVRVDPRDAALAASVQAGLGVAARVEADLDGTAGGVVVETADGRTASNTLEDRLARALPRLRAALAPTLAGPAAP